VGPTSAQALSNMTEKLKGKEIVKSLIVWYKNSGSHPEKMTFPTIFAPI